MLFTNSIYFQASTALIRSYRNAALCTGHLYSLEEEKAQCDSEKGYFGYWANCRWVRFPENPSAPPDTGAVTAASDSIDDSSYFGTDCQPDASTSESGALVNYDSDSSYDTGSYAFS